MVTGNNNNPLGSARGTKWAQKKNKNKNKNISNNTDHLIISSVRGIGFEHGFECDQ